MDWQGYIFAGAVSLMALFIGLILLFVWHVLKTRQQKRMRAYLSRELVWKVKKVMMDAASESMDMMPDKIMEVKRTIDERS